MPVRIKLSKAGERVETREILFDQDLISIGRDAACALCLADPLVSKTHARIERQGGAWTITDLHSTNSTFLNGEKLAPDHPCTLHPGDSVKIAPFELDFLAVELPLPAFEPVSSLNRLQQPAPDPAPSWTSFGPPDTARAMRTIRTLLDFLTRLSSGQSSFLSEFVVRTTFRTGVSLPGHFQSGDEAVRYFADPALSDDEFASRQSELETMTTELILHVMGLLEGYRKSVDDGARRLLAQMDPEPLRRELSDPNKTSGPRHVAYQIFPALLDAQVYRQLEQRHQDLNHEDRGVLEKRYFRPGFIRGYEARVASPGRNTLTGD